MNSDFSYDDETVTSSDKDQPEGVLWKDADDLPEAAEKDDNAPQQRSTEGPYQIGPMLGKGGMATIYDGWDAMLERYVAVKIPHPDIASVGEHLQRFFNEAQVLAQMEHPGIIPVHAAGRLEDGQSFYAMRKIRGQTMAEILKKRSADELNDRCRRDELVSIFERICETVAYAHSNRIIHRDLKPANIMVDEFGVVLVLDWGLAKKLDGSPDSLDQTVNGDIKGTPAYMSPEQAEGDVHTVDCRTDVFALGVILYLILTGRPAYTGNTGMEILEAVLNRDPTPLLEANPKADKVLAAICQKAMHRNPEMRYVDAGQLAKEIQAWRDHRRVRAYTPTLLDRVGDWVYRNTSLAATLLTAILLAGIFGGVFWHEQREQRLLRLEEEKRATMIAELKQKEQQNFIRSSMSQVQHMVAKVHGIDKNISKLKSALEADTDREGQAALTQSLNEYRTVRDQTVRQISAHITSIMQVASGGESGMHFADIPADIRNTIKNLMIADIESRLQIGELYMAHALVSADLSVAAEIGWSPTEMQRLLELRSQAEERLRQQGQSIPDWSQYNNNLPLAPTQAK